MTRLAAPFLAACTVIAADPPSGDLERRFQQTVRPFLNKHCMGCHGTTTPAAQFDLRPYSTLQAVVSDLGHWGHVLERLSAKDMPPKQMPQPAASARQEVIDWVVAVRMSEARKNAGDPGPVLVRRLSNAEYDNTIRDLTGVDLRPTREFPVDPANTAGFDNSGESLSMSPALLNKYLQAARHVADHMVLTQDGFDFAPHPMLVETDREKYAIQRIVNFYKSQPTDYADYFQAGWRYRHRAALGKPRSTLLSIAGESGLSAKYLPQVWEILTTPTEPGSAEVGPIAKLQKMWQSLPAPGGKPEDLREKCVEMRDFVVRLRKRTAMEFAAPVVRGLSPTSQPLMNWKLRAFAAHRRDFDRKALRLASEPPLTAPTIGRQPGLGQEAAFRAALLMQKLRAGEPDLIVPDGQMEAYEKSFARLASVFPDVFYISERGRFFPDDSEDKGRLLSAGYHNVMGYFRDDTPLMELILDDAGQKHLNRLWDEFDFIGDYTTRTWIQYFFNQSGEVQGNGRESGTQRPSDKAVTAAAMVFQLRDAYLAKAQANPANDPIAEQAIRQHFSQVNDTMRNVERMRAEAAPHHLRALLRFAGRAFRRPLTKAEGDDILTYYKTLMEKNALSHEEAMRDSIVSVLMSPKFSYRIDLVDDATVRLPGQAAIVSAAAKTRPLSQYGLANRLSYFLWSSMPDEELLARAQAGDLRRPDVLTAQVRRMLKDERAKGLATEFAGNWLDFRRFEDFNSVDRERFPSFTNELRSAMFQEPVRFVEDVIRRDRPVIDLLYGKDTFVNPVLARHYGMPAVEGAAEKWVRVDNARDFGRGGLLAMSVFLTQNSPGLRTSPVKRGYWVAKRVLGENIPPPPPQVPELPTDEAKSDLPLRQMLANHRNNPACSSCHSRFDSFGLVFEGYGPTGEKRDKDLAGRPVDTQATFPDGGEGTGFAGVETYIREHRQGDFVDNLSRKLLAYALGRSLQLSDEIAIDRMKSAAAARGFRFASFIETIVNSPQFLNKRVPAVSEQKGE